jgi:hypothetical protein
MLTEGILHINLCSLQVWAEMAVDIPIDPALLPCAMLPPPSTSGNEAVPHCAPQLTSDLFKHKAYTSPAQDENGHLIPTHNEFLRSL